ncbi:MAG: acyl-CoA thioesterase [Gemmatimonadetes bacterium]|nr:acyl-CoA thioesterase [Gemmatimonadota bacterium]
MPTPQPPRAQAAETVITVRSGEIDSFGHVNHAVFLSYLEHARYEALEAAGFRWPSLEENDWQIYVVRIEVDYLAQARRGDALLVRTWAEGFRRTSMVLGQEIVRGTDEGEPTVVARARVTAVWIGPDRRPMRVPDYVRSGLLGEPE